jgi:succinate-semialdehyde dehydrogenase/glutarate-semialdehyde dehydrogenase
MNSTTELGPMSSEAAAVHIIDQIRKSVDAGQPLLGGTRSDLPGAFVQPTILTDLNPEFLRIMKKYLVLWLLSTESSMKKQH